MKFNEKKIADFLLTTLPGIMRDWQSPASRRLGLIPKRCRCRAWTLLLFFFLSFFLSFLFFSFLQFYFYPEGL